MEVTLPPETAGHMVLRRESSVTRRESDASRRDSIATTTISSDETSPRRKSSVMVTPGEWRPVADREGVSNGGDSSGFSRRGSALSRVSSHRLSQDVAEINFSNGETASVGTPRLSLSSPSMSGRMAAISQDPLISPSASARRLSDGSSTAASAPASSRPLSRSGSQANGLSGEEANQASSLARHTSGMKPDISEQTAFETGAPSVANQMNGLPPLPPLAKRLSNLVKPKVPAKLRSLVKRGSSDIEQSLDKDDALPESPSNPNSAPTLTPILESTRQNSDAARQDDGPLSPGRSRIYTVDQAGRRGSFLPTNRLNEGTGGLGPRRMSVRLSEADVGLLLGKVSKISSETLRQAAMEGNSTLCEALVRGSVPIDETDLDGKSALMLAAEYGRSDTTEHLLSFGAGTEIKDDNGMTALCLAVVKTKVSCVKVLVTWGADCNVAVNGDSIATLALLKLEESLKIGDEKDRKVSYENTSEVSRILVKESKVDLILRREKLRKQTLFLFDEWVRAKAAGEDLVIPPMEKLVDGEKTLINFLKQHRQRVNVIATIKIWIVILFIGFDLATREMKMTPARLLTYAVLYIGAYYL